MVLSIGLRSKRSLTKSFSTFWSATAKNTPCFAEFCSRSSVRAAKFLEQLFWSCQTSRDQLFTWNLIEHLQNGFGQLLRSFKLILNNPGKKLNSTAYFFVRVGRRFQSIELEVRNSMTISAWYENNDQLFCVKNSPILFGVFILDTLQM